MKKLLGAVLMASLTLACGGSQLSDATDKAASSSLQASLQANSPSSPTLTAAECNFFGQSGTFNICHVNGSGKFVPTAVTTSSCLNGHAGHAGDYIATATDPDCKHKDQACFPAGAPKDNYIPCCSGVVDDNGRCAEVCNTGDGWWNGANPIKATLVVQAGAVCRMSGVEVQGDTSVNGSLYTIGSTFDGNVGVDGGCLTTANNGNTFVKSVSITNSPGCWLGGAVQNGFWSPNSPTTIGKNFSYVNNSVPLYIGYGPTTVGGDFTYSGSPCASDSWPTSVGGTSHVTCP
jgi:hypothetical protein